MENRIEEIPELIRSEALFIQALRSHFELMKNYGFGNDFIETKILNNVSDATNNEVQLYR